ncbi:MAG: hypothetical protein K6G64_04205 [Eubacterium sp.]|nr:hypothetical protein [Eubacterium sp.]
MNVKIFSREATEDLLRQVEKLENTAVISFYDPPSKTFFTEKPIDFGKKVDYLFQVAVNDIDIEVLPRYGLTEKSFFTEAEELAEFIREAKENGMDIICQCEYGQSRSAACAAAILEYYDRKGITVFADYRYYPNQLVFNKIYDALKSENSFGN